MSLYVLGSSVFFFPERYSTLHVQQQWLRGLFALLVLVESIDLSCLFVYSLAFCIVVLFARHKGIHKSLLVPLFSQEAPSSVISCFLLGAAI